MAVNSRIASYMPGGDTSQRVLDRVSGELWGDPRVQQLCTMQLLEKEDLSARHAQGRLRLLLDIRREQNALRKEQDVEADQS